MTKLREDFVKVKAKKDAVSVCGPTYEYHIGAEPVELPKAVWNSVIFASTRELLEVTEDPVLVSDAPKKSPATGHRPPATEV